MRRGSWLAAILCTALCRTPGTWETWERLRAISRGAPTRGTGPACVTVQAEAARLVVEHVRTGRFEDSRRRRTNLSGEGQRQVGLLAAGGLRQQAGRHGLQQPSLCFACSVARGSGCSMEGVSLRPGGAGPGSLRPGGGGGLLSAFAGGSRPKPSPGAKEEKGYDEVIKYDRDFLLAFKEVRAEAEEELTVLTPRRSVAPTCPPSWSPPAPTCCWAAATTSSCLRRSGASGGGRRRGGKGSARQL